MVNVTKTVIVTVIIWVRFFQVIKMNQSYLKQNNNNSNNIRLSCREEMCTGLGEIPSALLSAAHLHNSPSAASLLYPPQGWGKATSHLLHRHLATSTFPKENNQNPFLVLDVKTPMNSL